MTASKELDMNIEYLSSQDEVFFNTPEQFVVVPKGRRAGFTRGAAQFAVECLLSGRSVLWVDTIQLHLDSYYKMYFLPIVRQIPSYLYQYRQSYHDLTINGVKLDMRSAERPENIEGFAYHVIILNESGIILRGQRGRSLWMSTLLPMVMDYNADVYFIGTPKGLRKKRGEMSDSGYCLYYELALLGGLKGDKDPDWATKVYDSYSNPKLSHDVIKKLESKWKLAYRKQEIQGEFIDFSQEAIFHASWWHFVDELPPAVNRRRLFLSIDTAFKIGEENDFSAFSVVLEHRTGFVWMFAIAEKLEFPQLIERTCQLYDEYRPDLVLVEDRASGQSLIQTLKQNVPFPVAGYKSDRDKVARAQAVTPMFAEGRVQILRGPWNKEALDQLIEFNATLDSPDDIVDSITQVLNFAKGSSITQKPVILKNRVSKRFKSHALMQGYY